MNQTEFIGLKGDKKRMLLPMRQLFERIEWIDLCKKAVLSLLIFLFMAGFSYGGNMFQKLDSLILSGELEQAEVEMYDLTRKIDPVGDQRTNPLPDYFLVIRALKDAQKVKEQASNFDNSKMEKKDYDSLIAAYNRFSVSWKELTRKKLRIHSSDLENMLNSMSDDMKNRIDVAKQAYKTAENERLKARVEALLQAEAKRRDEEQKRELARVAAVRQAEAKRRDEEQKRELARAEEERKKKKKQEEEERVRKEEERARKEAWEQKLAKLDNAAKKLGYKGINRESGIVRFLYNAAIKGNLEEGLGQVFWSGISKKQSEIDGQFKLSQVVDGWEIYEFRELCNNPKEWVVLSIAIPTEGMPIEGQRLKHDFHVFEGNISFTSITGVKRIIQKFKPVRINE